MNWLMLCRCGCLGGVSPVKMFRTVQQNIPTLMHALWNGDEQELIKILKRIEQSLYQILQQQKRKKTKHKTVSKKRKTKLQQKNKHNSPKK
jgi:2'-5' RNA ligase